jgi:hypothetical protein
MFQSYHSKPVNCFKLNTVADGALIWKQYKQQIRVTWTCPGRQQIEARIKLTPIRIGWHVSNKLQLSAPCASLLLVRQTHLPSSQIPNTPSFPLKIQHSFLRSFLKVEGSNPSATGRMTDWKLRSVLSGGCGEGRCHIGWRRYHLTHPVMAIVYIIAKTRTYWSLKRMPCQRDVPKGEMPGCSPHVRNIRPCNFKWVL